MAKSLGDLSWGRGAGSQTGVVQRKEQSFECSVKENKTQVQKKATEDVLKVCL